MGLRINDTIPDLTVETDTGAIRLHDWIGDSWAILFSHPKDFTPVCTTELGALGRLMPQFERRGVKVIGISADPVDTHVAWKQDIEEIAGTVVGYPLIGDPELKVAKLYGMLPQNASGAGFRTAAATRPCAACS